MPVPFCKRAVPEWCWIAHEIAPVAGSVLSAERDLGCLPRPGRGPNAGITAEMGGEKSLSLAAERIAGRHHIERSAFAAGGTKPARLRRRVPRSVFRHVDHAEEPGRRNGRAAGNAQEE